MNVALEPWVSEAIELMLHERCTFLQAANQLGVVITDAQAAAMQRRRSFRDLYERAASAHYAAKTNPVQHSKAALVGRLLDNAERLATQGKFKEASDILVGVAKIEGWAGSDTSVPIFLSLSGGELSRAIEQVRSRHASTSN